MCRHSSYLPQMIKTVSSLLARSVILTLNSFIMHYLWISNVQGLEICFAFHLKYKEALLAEIVIYYWHPIFPSIISPRRCAWVWQAEKLRCLLYSHQKDLEPTLEGGWWTKEANWSPCGSELKEVVFLKRQEIQHENIAPTRWAFMVPAVLWITMKMM